jgi:hypothetical protein
MVAYAVVAALVVRVIGFRIKGLGFEVYGFGPGVQGLWFRV